MKTAKRETRGMEYPFILYSTNTWLAYEINKKYYKHNHYVWCAPVICYEKPSFNSMRVPSSSDPINIYRRLLEDIHSGDKHCQKVKDNKIGIIKGATSKQEQEIITKEQEQEIISIVNMATMGDFYPLLYVIPFSKVKKIVKKVSVEKRAHPLSDEYLIESLHRKYFDVIFF
jgi:hypothetical protein